MAQPATRRRRPEPGFAERRNNREHFFERVAFVRRTWQLARIAWARLRGYPMLRLAKNLRSVTNADGGVVLDLGRGQIFRCNATGAVVLEILARGETEEGVVREVTRRCHADVALVSADVHEFLISLRSHALLSENDRD